MENRRDPTWETQSDTAAPAKDLRDDDMSGDTVRPELTLSPSRASTDRGDAERERNDSVGQENDDVDMQSKQDRPSNTSRNVRPKLVHIPNSDSAVEGASRHSTLPETVPGPPKATVVVRDVAYSTYLAFLYYVSATSLA